MPKKVILMVMDSVGVGALPDADRFQDGGSDTVGNIIRVQGKLDIPNLISLGMGNIDGVSIPYHCDDPIGCYGKAAEAFFGKDTTGGHWEIAGLVLDKPFPTYPNGFPKEVISEFEKRIGTKVLYNKTASGTVIINQLGDEHVRTGYPIVYTSADSVFQIAAHEEVVPTQRLYQMCQAAREILTGEHNVGRVIARPFTGSSGNYTRTRNRKDFSVVPPRDTMLDYIKRNGMTVFGIGKIEDIFANKGLTRSNHTTCNADGVAATLDAMAEDFSGLIFTNLVDFDMLYGHRNDAEGYARALERFDCQIPRILEAMGEEDLLIITADHGCDPTTESTDHSREYIPILVFGKRINGGVNLGIRHSFSDIAATVAEYLSIFSFPYGKSFLNEIL